MSPQPAIRGFVCGTLAGAFAMFLHRSNREGRVDLHALGPRTTRFVYDVSWE
ncbi:MAG TPA: hypothetical protein VE057_27850 [Archangium sp.]|nr:hypothetical protein [Archangium sp.]